MKKDYWKEDEVEEDPDLYSLEELGNQCDDDLLDSDDAAFMEGYLAA